MGQFGWTGPFGAVYTRNLSPCQQCSLIWCFLLLTLCVGQLLLTLDSICKFLEVERAVHLSSCSRNVDVWYIAEGRKSQRSILKWLMKWFARIHSILIAYEWSSSMHNVAVLLQYNEEKSLPYWSLNAMVMFQVASTVS